MAKFNKKKEKKEKMITIPKSMYNQMLFEIGLLQKTQLMLDAVEDIPAFDGKGYTDIVGRVIKFAVVHSAIASKTNKQLKIDIKNILDNCTSICYLKGDDFGAHPIRQTNKAKVVYEITKYMCQGIQNWEDKNGEQNEKCKLR